MHLRAAPPCNGRIPLEPVHQTNARDELAERRRGLAASAVASRRHGFDDVAASIGA
jgi:hypothetical protein